MTTEEGAGSCDATQEPTFPSVLTPLKNIKGKKCSEMLALSLSLKNATSSLTSKTKERECAQKRFLTNWEFSGAFADDSEEGNRAPSSRRQLLSKEGDTS